jgi:hypothetical protein
MLTNTTDNLINHEWRRKMRQGEGPGAGRWSVPG